MTALIQAMRPRQWLKNLLVLAAPGAGGVIARAPVLQRSSVALGAFCLASSSMYLVNDVIDAPADRLHPTRRRRPVAEGRLSPGVALGAAIGLLGIATAAGWWLGPRFLLVLGAFAVLALSYSLVLKRIAVIDIAAVASGFLLRAIAGGVATGIPSSRWFLLLTSFGSLFVVAGKRYQEAGSRPAAGSGGPPARLPAYTRPYLRYVWTMASTLTIAAYCLWVLSFHPHTVRVLVALSSVPFVLAVLRYGLLLDAGLGGTPEDVFLGDRALQSLAVAWLAVYGGGVYLAAR